ncbi:MAG: hypothetical protein H6994_12820 [Pseudomonadales bacterium]|nr:hypothetical protein [Pseudomonadales bacterium]
MYFTLSDEVLLALAQIAVSIIGFSGVVVTLGRAEKERWSASELLQLRTLVEPSMVVLLGSLLPLLIALADVSPEHLWRVANAGLLGLHAIGHGLFLARGAKHKSAVTRSQQIISAMSVLVYVAQFASVFNVIRFQELTFLIGLLYALWISIHNFYLLLFGRSNLVTDHSTD